MTYIKVAWSHNFPDEPNLLYSELDGHRWEVRKVEVFPNGRFGYASRLESYGGSILSEKPLPSNDEISKHTEFCVREIKKEEFEDVWLTFTDRANPAV